MLGLFMFASLIAHLFSGAFNQTLNNNRSLTRESEIRRSGDKIISHISNYVFSAFKPCAPIQFLPIEEGSRTFLCSNTFVIFCSDVPFDVRPIVGRIIAR